MDQVGLEPTTYCMQNSRSTNWSYKPSTYLRQVDVRLVRNTVGMFNGLAALNCAPILGLEPRTYELTVRRSAIELYG